MAVESVSVVRIQSAQGLGCADRRGRGGRGDAGHAGLVRRCPGFRWRFQFSIRSLLVLVVVVSVPCSWLAVEIKRARVQEAALERLLASELPLSFR